MMMMLLRLLLLFDFLSETVEVGMFQEPFARETSGRVHLKARLHETKSLCVDIRIPQLQRFPSVGLWNGEAVEELVRTEDLLVARY